MTNFEGDQQPAHQAFENPRLILGNTVLELAAVDITVDPAMQETDPAKYQRAVDALAALASYGSGVTINIQPKTREAWSASEREAGRVLNPKLFTYHNIGEDPGPVPVVEREHFINVGGKLGVTTYKALRVGASNTLLSDTVEFLHPYVVRDETGAITGFNALRLGAMIEAKDDLRDIRWIGNGAIDFLRDLHNQLWVEPSTDMGSVSSQAEQTDKTENASFNMLYVDYIYPDPNNRLGKPAITREVFEKYLQAEGIDFSHEVPGAAWVALQRYFNTSKELLPAGVHINNHRQLVGIELNDFPELFATPEVVDGLRYANNTIRDFLRSFHNELTGQASPAEVPFSERPYLEVIENSEGDEVLAITEASFLNHVGTFGRYENKLSTIKGVTALVWRRIEGIVKSGVKVYNRDTGQREHEDIRHLVVMNADDRLAYIPAASLLELCTKLNTLGRNESRIFEGLKKRIEDDARPRA